MHIRNSGGVILLLGGMFACGGGSKAPEPLAIMSISTHKITVSGAQRGLVPTALVTVTLSGGKAAVGQCHLQYQTTYGLVSSVAFNDSSDTTITLLVTFSDPNHMAVGVSTDTLVLGLSTDAAGNCPITGSPQPIFVAYTVTGPKAAAITSLDPPTVEAGSAGFTLTANGFGFSYSSELRWNGASLRTNYISNTQLTATIKASDIVEAGTANVSAYDTEEPSLTSPPASFTISLPDFSITRVSPSPLCVNGPDRTLDVRGFQFLPTSVVNWNGSPLATTFMSSTHLAASLPASSHLAVGTAQVTVVNPGAPPRTSNARLVLINSAEAVAIQINPQHSGAIQFSSATLPSSSLWSRSLEGPPSYPLIAHGKVYVTVTVPGGSELIAMEQETGATVWGPIFLAGRSNAAYDDGKVFVAREWGVVQAFDAGTGATLWSTLLPGGDSTAGAPTATGGRVYAQGNTALHTFDQTTGSLGWSQNGGGACSPAVTPDGVYLTFTGTAMKLNPATGASLWTNWAGWSGGGGATPVAANGLLFAPDGFTNYNGNVLDETTGGRVNTYVADKPPAMGGENGFFLQGGVLRCLDISSGGILWSFQGDGLLVSSPILVNDFVFIGSSAGNLYALDAVTGSQLWTRAMDGALPGGENWGSWFPMSGLAAGDGLLVIPAGNTLTAFQLTQAP